MWIEIRLELEAHRKALRSFLDEGVLGVVRAAAWRVELRYFIELVAHVEATSFRECCGLYYVASGTWHVPLLLEHFARISAKTKLWRFGLLPLWLRIVLDICDNVLAAVFGVRTLFLRSETPDGSSFHGRFFEFVLAGTWHEFVIFFFDHIAIKRRHCRGDAFFAHNFLCVVSTWCRTSIISSFGNLNTLLLGTKSIPRCIFLHVISA